jgi:UDP-glucose 4-epimerase
VVDGVLRACHAKDASGEVINVATNGRVSLNQLFKALRVLIGADVEPVYEEPRAGDVRDSQADIGKAARLLGYAPLVPFDEASKRPSSGIALWRKPARAQPSLRRCRHNLPNRAPRA